MYVANVCIGSKLDTACQRDAWRQSDDRLSFSAISYVSLLEGLFDDLLTIEVRNSRKQVSQGSIGLLVDFGLRVWDFVVLCE